MKIYTRTGDEGMTSLADGTRVSKADALLNAYGTVDELNAFIGVVIAQISDPFLTDIQNQLFTVGGMLATPPEQWSKYWGNVDLMPFINLVEREIDKLSAEVEPFHGFVLPQGSRLIADLHVCRTVCRRTERQIALFVETDKTYKTILKLLNRLSDYFFLLTVFYHKENNIPEIYWKSVK